MGDLAIVLHSHMPYVEGFGTYPFGEEWLFDAVLRCYSPVTEVARKLTMTVTPVLADQLESGGVAERLEEFVARFRIESAEAEVTDVDEPFREACRAEATRFDRALGRLRELEADLLGLFAEPAGAGRIELMSSAATHAVLPLLATLGGRRLQLDAGLRSHTRRFGEPAGFWLPECAYEPGLERLLAERELDYFCVDQSAGSSPLAALAPIGTAAGPVAFPIDWEAISWLWSLDGYPSDPVHADFHRKSMRGVRLWSIGGGPYDPAAAEARAFEQAEEFLIAASRKLERFRAERGRAGLLVLAVDTELLGHWWWEGPSWLEGVLGGAAVHEIETVTLSEALARHEAQVGTLHRSSWGEDKDLSTWDSPEVADLAWAARRLELRLLRGLERGLEGAAAKRAARELLAVQSSDWAFLDRRRQAGDYPYQRSTDHAWALLEALDSAARPPLARIGEPGSRPEPQPLARDLEVAPAA